MTTDENDTAVNNFRDYIRIRSVQPNINYDECISFLRRKAEELGLSHSTYETVPKKPVLVMTWEGQDPSLPSILLMSHMDVVPVFEDSWTYPPFEGRIVDGVIYGRGTQDMKSIAIQYLEAIRRLKKQNVTLKRTIHLSFAPDEEIGGADGMGAFSGTENFKKLNVGFALDEGFPSSTDEFIICTGERSIWHINIECPGTTGHGSFLLPGTAGEKIRYIIDKFMDLRQESVDKLKANPQLTVGDVTSVNLTKLSGGVQNNVLPEKLTVHFDLRLDLNLDFDEFENRIKRWCKEAGEGVTYNFNQKEPYVAPTSLESNIYWDAMKGALDKLEIKYSIHTFPAGTDSRFVRSRGVQALDMTPLRRTIPKPHGHDEGVKVVNFLEGIQVYQQIIPAVANV